MFTNRSVIENHLPTQTIIQVAHYTKIGTLCHFIPEASSGWASAWATPVQFLNDRMELTLGLDVLSKEAYSGWPLGHRLQTNIEALLITAGTLESDAFQMSFSGNPDELGQWRGYAANGMGCSVVTDVVEVARVADVAGWVIYDPVEQSRFATNILTALQHEQDNNLIQQTLTAAASYMKHDGFKPEMEFRLITFPNVDSIKFRESGDRLVPYVDYLKGKLPLPMREIKIGPGWQLSKLVGRDLLQNHVVQGIYRLLEARSLHTAVQINSSKIPYDPR